MAQLPWGLSLSQMQMRWKALLNPFLGNPSLQSLILPDISLAAGTNTVNHRLDRPLLGWRIIRISAAATIFDTQDGNAMPNLTLLLTSSAPCVVSLEVF